MNNNCPYCSFTDFNGKNFAYFLDEEVVCVSKEEEEYYISVVGTEDSGSVVYETATQNIRYCPMCGRKL